MSGSAIVVAELTTSVEDAPARATAATDRLLGQQIVQPQARPDPLWRPSRYAPGPAATTAVRDIHVAGVAVHFHNWPPLADAFLHGLFEHLGPRCRLIQRRVRGA
ncbi:hypothetical protein ACIQK9_16030 [Streptomyces hydrogenans]|uniref:hypothetical protein n=1 Tax=Streptomyces hydrogenans TaxID=1873719 RepID=UPI0037F8CE95